MNQKILEYNWIFRRNSGLLYGYVYKPGLVSDGNFIFPQIEVRPVAGDKGVLIKEKDNDLGFIPKNELIHIGELFQKGVVK